MKNIIYPFIAFAVSFSMFYLLGAFVMANIDFTQWNQTERVVVGVVGFLISCFVMVAVGISLEKNNKNSNQ